MKNEDLPKDQQLAGKELQELIDAGGADFEVDNRIAWLNFFDASTLLQKDRIGPLLLETFVRMKNAGFSSQAELCNECNQEPGVALTFEKGRVQQICTSCDSQAKQAVTLDPANLPFVLGIGTISALVGAICWAVSWTLFDHGLAWIGGARMPMFVLVLLYAVIGFVTALPTAFILKKIPKRGNILAGWFGAAFVIISAVIGEVGYVGWMIYEAVDILSLAVTLDFFGSIIAEYPIWAWIGKVTGAGLGAVLAYEMVKPTKRTVINLTAGC